VENRYDPLLLLAVLVFFVGLGANSIWDANEAFYVDTPRHMVQTQDYVTPRFNGEERLNKPVLSYWIVAAFYHAFGMSVTSERLAIAVGAVGILLATLALGRQLRSTATGVLAALLLATAPRFVHFARRNVIDIYLTLFMAIALAAFVRAMRRPGDRRSWLLVMYTAIGLGVLTKGPVALLLPAAVIGLWLLLERRLPDLRQFSLPLGGLIILAIVVPWYAAVHGRHGWDPIWSFFVGENLGRFAESMTTDRSPFFFVGVLFGDILLPWAPLLLIPLWTGWRREPGAGAEGSIRRLLWLWIVVIVVAFSFSASKEDLYILPVAPAAAALIADALMGTGAGARHRGVRVILIVVCALVVALGAAVWWLLGSGYYRVADAPIVSGLLAGGGLLTIGLIAVRRHRLALAAILTTFVAFNWLFVLRVLPAVESLKPVPALAELLRRRATHDAPIASFHLSQPSLVFYLSRPVPELWDANEVVQLFTTQPEVWLVTSEAEWTRLQPRLPNTCVAWRRPRFDARLPDVLRGVPPPDITLVTNRCPGVGSPPR
jgi:4-amino-4-deoxy-L-arabinose transferase-like glycosyltransferase